jgi:hypothetical protein
MTFLEIFVLVLAIPLTVIVVILGVALGYKFTRCVIPPRDVL